MTAIQIHECLSELRKLSLSDIEFDFLQAFDIITQARGGFGGPRFAACDKNAGRRLVH